MRQGGRGGREGVEGVGEGGAVEGDGVRLLAQVYSEHLHVSLSSIVHLIPHIYDHHSLPFPLVLHLLFTHLRFHTILF